MTLEDELRRMFEARAEALPAVHDPAGRAIGRARAVRRHRAVVTGSAAALVLVLSLGAAVALVTGRYPGRGGQAAGGSSVGSPLVEASPLPESPTPVPTGIRLARRTPLSSPVPPLRKLGMDLRIGDELWTANGDRYVLSGVGRVARVYRVQDGWIYGGKADVRLLRLDGTSIPLGDLGTSWLPSVDGTQVVAVKGRRLVVYSVGKVGLVEAAGVSVPDGAEPVAFAGDQVVISTGREGPYAVVRSTGSDAPVWSKTVVTVYGTAGDTVTALVRISGVGDQVCLAVLRPEEQILAVESSGLCRSGLAARWTGVLAPDGGWVAESLGGKLRLTELSSAFAGRERFVICPAVTETPPVWVDSESVLFSDGRAVMECRTDGSIRSVPLPATALREGWSFVPELFPVKNQ